MRGVTQLKYSPAVAREIFETMVKRSSKDMRISAVFELFPLGKINSISNEACAYNIRSVANNVLCLVSWDENTKENAKLGQDNCRVITGIVSNSEQVPQDSQDRAYGNYVGDETLAYAKAQRVFGTNYPRLQQIKKKYDPENIFSKWFAITPA